MLLPRASHYLNHTERALGLFSQLSASVVRHKTQIPLGAYTDFHRNFPAGKEVRPKT